MMQLYCPACENVVWVEENAPDDSPCPECEQPIRCIASRKARPVNGDAVAAPEAHVFAPPERITCPSWVPPAAPPPEALPAAQANWEEEDEQDFRVPCPDPAPRFVPLPYRAEGGVSWRRLPVFLTIIALSGVLLGILASVVGQVCYLVLLYPLALGLGVAGLTILLGQICRVRSPAVAGATALCGGLLALAAMHALDYRRTVAIAETAGFRLPAELTARLKKSSGLLDYLDAIATEGLTITGHNSGGVNLGYAGTCVYWAVEVLLVVLIAVVGGASGAREPFCSACNHWKEERFLGTLADGGAEQQRQLQRGDLAALHCWRPALTGGELALTASVCSRCGPESPIDLKIERNPRGRRDPASKNLPMHLTYPGEALPVLEAMFIS